VTRDPATIRQLKEQSGKDLWLWGSSKLMHSMMDAGVVDEIRMLVCPVSRGKGTHIFEDRQDLKLVEATAFENGVVTRNLSRSLRQHWSHSLCRRPPSPQQRLGAG
jgi:dihydrofolate reductase